MEQEKIPSEVPVPPVSTPSQAPLINQTSIFLIACGLCLIGFFLNWFSISESRTYVNFDISQPFNMGHTSTTNNSVTGINLIGKLADAGGWAFILLAFVIAVPIGSLIIGVKRYNKKQVVTTEIYWTSMITFLPLFALTVYIFASDSGAGIMNIGDSLKNSYGGGLWMMIIGSLVLLYVAITKIIADNKTNATNKLLKPGLIGGLIYGGALFILVKLFAENNFRNTSGALLFLPLGALSVAIAIALQNLKAGNPKKPIIYADVISIGFLTSLAGQVFFLILLKLFYSEIMSYAPLGILVSTVILLIQVGFIISSIGCYWLPAQLHTANTPDVSGQGAQEAPQLRKVFAQFQNRLSKTTAKYNTRGVLIAVSIILVAVFFVPLTWFSSSSNMWGLVFGNAGGYNASLFRFIALVFPLSGILMFHGLVFNNGSYLIPKRVLFILPILSFFILLFAVFGKIFNLPLCSVKYWGAGFWLAALSSACVLLLRQQPAIRQADATRRPGPVPQPNEPLGTTPGSPANDYQTYSSQQATAAYPPNTYPPFNAADWFRKNRKAIFLGIGGVFTILLLIVAVKFVLSIDFNKNKDQAANATQADTVFAKADSTAMAPVATSTSQGQNAADTVASASAPQGSQSTDATYRPGYYTVVATPDNKVYYHNTPDPSTVRKGYFDEQDVVYVQKIQNGFGYVEFTNKIGQTSAGWLNMQDLNWNATQQ